MAVGCSPQAPQFGSMFAGPAPSPQLPVRGGSGTYYASIADALALEVETVYTGISVAGTMDGVVVGPGTFPAADDALNGAWVVLTDPSPGSGLAAQYARIIDYIGASRTMILDAPWNFGVGKAIAAILPAIITVNGDLAETVSIGKSAELNLGGGRLLGGITITAGAFHWVREGSVSNGILKSSPDVGALRLDNVVSSRREGSIYAFLSDQSVNVGSVEFYGCQMRGVVAARQGIGRLVWHDSTNPGLAVADGDVPVRILEADGIARVFDNLFASLDGPFRGSVFYVAGAAGSITTGPSGFLQVTGRVGAQTFGRFGTSAPPNRLSLLLANGLSSASINAMSGSVEIDGGPDSTFSIADIVNGGSPGSWTMDLDVRCLLGIRDANEVCGVRTSGTVPFTGAVTVTGDGSKEFVCDGSYFSLVQYGSTASSGSVTFSGPGLVSCRGALQAAIFAFRANQTVGPGVSTSISAELQFENIGDLLGIGLTTGVASITVGTHTLSSLVSGQGIELCQTHMTGAFSGGSLTISGAWNLGMTSGGRGSSGSVSGPFLVLLGTTSAPLVACSHDGSGGSITRSGAFRAFGGRHLSYRHCHKTTGPGGTATMSGISTLGHMEFVNAFAFVFSNTAGGTAVGSGPIDCSYLRFGQTGATAQQNIVNLSAGFLTGPSEVDFVHCEFAFNLATQFLVAGVLTWAGAAIRFRFSTVSGVFVIVGTAFSTFLAFRTLFGGNVSDLAVSFSGVRPTVYDFFMCEFPNGRPYSTVAAGGKPNLIRGYQTVPNNGTAKVAGQLVKLNSSGQAITPVVGPSSGGVFGVVLRPAAAVTGVPVVVVYQGTINVLTDAVAAGDECEQDTALPDRVDTASGALPGRGRTIALEAAGAGALAYSEVIWS